MVSTFGFEPSSRSSSLWKVTMNRDIEIPEVLKQSGGISLKAFNRLCEYADTVDPRPGRVILPAWIPFSRN